MLHTVRRCPPFEPFTYRLGQVGNSQANEELVFLGNSDGYPGEYSVLATSDGRSSFWMSTHCIKTLGPANGLDERVAAIAARLRQGLIQPMASYVETIDTEPFMFDGWPQTEISYDELAALFQYSTDQDRYLLESSEDALRLKLRLAVLLATERLGEIEVAVLESVSDPNQVVVIIGNAYSVEIPSSYKSTHMFFAHTHPVEDTSNPAFYPLRVPRGFSTGLEEKPRTGLFVAIGDGGDVDVAFFDDHHTEYVLAPFLSETDEVEFVVADFSQLWSTKSETKTARFHTPFGIVTGVPTPIRH